MLSRVATRSSRLDTTAIRTSNAARQQLILPWLTPTLPRHRQPRASTTRHITSWATEPSLRTSKNGAVETTTGRTFATHTDSYPVLSEDIPFEHASSQMADRNFDRPTAESIPFSSTPSSNTIDAYKLKDFDPNRTLINIPGMLAPAPERLGMRNGIAGDSADIYATLEACLRLGRIERGALIIQRFLANFTLSPDEAGRLHTEFLRVSLSRIMSEPNDEHANAMHKWFETHLRAKEVTVLPETIAIMLKASLQSKPGVRQDRLVTRYMEMVPREEAALEVFSCTNVLNAEDLNKINHIVPQHNLLAHLPQIVNEQLTDEEVKAVDQEGLPIANKDVDFDPSPEVKASLQKGLGLKSLRASLSMFSNKPEGFDPSKLSIEEQRLRQAKMEEDATISAVDRWREESISMAKMGLDTSLQTKSLGARMWRWQEALEARFVQELNAIDEAEAKPMSEKTDIDNERCSYGPFLRYLSAEKLAAVTILTTMQTLTSYGVDKGVPMAAIVMAVAKAIEDEGITDVLRNSLGDKGYVEFEKNVQKGGLGMGGMMNRPFLRKQVIHSLQSLVEGGVELNMQTEWTSTIRAKVGSCCLSALFETAKVPVSVQNWETKEFITQIQPAFSHTQQFRIGKKTGVLLANPALVAALQREPVHSLLAKHLPMLVPPEPWSRFNKGGFISQPAKVVRIKNGDKFQRYYQEAAIEKGDMEQIFRGLEVLGKTPWQINRQVYDVMLQAWNSGKAIADFPPDKPEIATPPEPVASLDPSDRRRWLRNLKAIENTKSAMHSVRCFMNFQLEIARAFRDEKFYFPHNVDFRGRAYPIPPYLNHMGADHCRGLLKFGVGKELGDRGLKWLRVHLANVHGFDKASLNEREQYAIDNMDNIRNSVEHPLDGEGWWLKAEDPWQCLAACHELVAALDSPDPTKFVSNLPVHQDGTCNGLQHYAALGGDSWGAAQVNLEPGDRPADVYSAVADLVKADIEVDAKAGDACAKWLQGKITRKVVKQTVMTNVYGVTFVGATQQVKKQLIAAYPDIPTADNFNAATLASYVAHRIFAALGSMFKGAHDIQYWLSECASRITTSLTPEQLDNMDRLLREPTVKNGHRMNQHQKALLDAENHFQFRASVVWTTPLRMPIVQPYRTTKSRVIKTNLQRISISEPHRSDPVSKRKQLQGFPPNFIHSLDATHMMLSAIESDEKGMTFAAVHDSFWTHAADVDSMNVVLRDAFIQMHSEDVVGRLLAEFEARHRGSLYLAQVGMETEFARRVGEWRRKVTRGEIANPYREMTRAKGRVREGSETYKRQQVCEALLERERIRLLHSEDPEEVAKGKAMETPISIYEELRGAEGSLQSDASLIPGLGDVSAGKPAPEIRGVKKAYSKQSAPVVGKPGERVDLHHEEGHEQDEDHHDEEALDADHDREMEHKDEGEHEEAPGGPGGEGMEETGFDSKTNSGKETFAKAVKGQSTTQRIKTTWVWLPLTFPKVPEKGSFDVTRLKDSQYFFS